MKYLKYFKQSANYQQFKESEEYILPNVSYVVDSTKVYYNPFETVKSGVIMAHYNATEENKLAIADTSNVKSLKVNGENVEFGDTYYFNEIGEYDVEIELIDNTLINGATMDYYGNPQSNSLFFDRESQGACLTSIVVPDSVISIGNAAFAACLSLTDIHIGSGVTEIGVFVFINCQSLTSIVIPDSVISIGGSAFQNCKSLTSINIPDSVISIGFQAFSECSGLTSVVIGSGVTTIGDNAFEYSLSLNEITCLAPTAPSITSSTFMDVKQGGILKVPTGSDYSSWMSTSNYYLGSYNWTVEYI